MALKYLMKTGQ